MSEYDNTNQGAIWGNDRKTEDRQPDFKGNINVEGKEYWVSAWKRRPDASPSSPSLKFSLTPKDPPKEIVNTAPGDATVSDDEIPF